ncbi:MAG: ABC transporter permease [Actinomycetota bacterium]
MTTTASTPVAAPEAGTGAAPGTRPGLRRRHRSRLRTTDALATGLHGLRGRKSRALLTALGIALGIASMVAVTGISASSKADLLAEIDRIGTNLLQVQGGNSVFGDAAPLPVEAPAMVRRIGPVQDASAVSSLKTEVFRNTFDEKANGLDVIATEPQLLNTLEGSVAAGRFLDAETSTLPTVVLGSVAAERLGIDDLDGAPTVDIAGRRFAVIGILDAFPLNPDLDRSVFIGNDAAENILGAELVPTAIYLRTTPEQVEAVREVLAATVSPTAPNEVSVSRPSDALEARAQVDQNLQNLLLGLGGIALLVGGVGIANVMIIAVLERRSEIGLRRALGATRRHIATQFILESASLAAFGGVLGIAVGTVVTIGYARRQGWLIDIPVTALAGGVVAALLLGALAGLYPASRAARLDPADAVRPG